MAESEQKKMRREFEAWALTRGINIERRSYPGDDFSKYRSVSTELEWIGFKAGWLARGKQEGWIKVSDQPPPENDSFIARVEYLYQGNPISERIVCYLGDNDELASEAGDDIGWPDDVIVEWMPLPAAPTETGSKKQ